MQAIRASSGRLSSEEREEAILSLAKREEAFRNDGDFEGLGQLLKPLGKSAAALSDLIGPDLRTTAELRKACANKEGEASDYQANYRAPAGRNLAADLAVRQEEEVEFILKVALKEQKIRVVVHFFIEVSEEFLPLVLNSAQCIQLTSNQFISNMKIVCRIICKRMNFLQTLWASGEAGLETAALAVGLMERVEDAKQKRPRKDRERGVRLAQARFAARQADPDLATALLRQPCPVPISGDSFVH